MVGAAWCTPPSIALFGIANAYVDGTPGLVLCLFCMFINGIGVDVVLALVAAYHVDVVQAHSAEAISAHLGVRNVLVAVASAAIVPSVERWGVLATNFGAAAVAVLGALALWSTIRFGEELRAYVDVGYSKIEDA